MNRKFGNAYLLSMNETVLSLNGADDRNYEKKVGMIISTAILLKQHGYPTVISILKAQDVPPLRKVSLDHPTSNYSIQIEPNIFLPNMPSRRPIRIGNISGATGDAPHAMFWIAQTGNVDVITGDWLSEMNIAWNAIIKRKDPELGYEVGFLERLSESIGIVADKKIKIVTNAGALNTAALTRKVEELCASRGLDGVVIASVYWDDVTEQDNSSHKDGLKSYPAVVDFP